MMAALRKYPHPNPLPKGEGIPELLRNMIIKLVASPLSSPLSLWERVIILVN